MSTISLGNGFTFEYFLGNPFTYSTEVSIYGSLRLNGEIVKGQTGAFAGKAIALWLGGVNEIDAAQRAVNLYFGREAKFSDLMLIK